MVIPFSKFRLHFTFSRLYTVNKRPWLIKGPSKHKNYSTNLEQDMVQQVLQRENFKPTCPDTRYTNTHGYLIFTCGVWGAFRKAYMMSWNLREFFHSSANRFIVPKKRAEGDCVSYPYYSECFVDSCKRFQYIAFGHFEDSFEKLQNSTKIMTMMRQNPQVNLWLKSQ